MTYQTLIAAARLIEQARLEVMRTEGDSPAWVKLLHATRYLHNQAAMILNGSV